MERQGGGYPNYHGGNQQHYHGGRSNGYYLPQQPQHNGYYQNSYARHQAPRYTPPHPQAPPPYMYQSCVPQYQQPPLHSAHQQARQQPQQVQPSYNVHVSNLSATAQEFVPSSFLTPRESSNHQQQMNEQQYDDSSFDDFALLQLQMFITDVTLSPAMYENKVYELADLLFEDIQATPHNNQTIVSTIIQAGILQQNFRYSGARLCDYLSTLVVVQGKNIFRDELLSQAFKSLNDYRPVAGDKEKDKEQRGLALFTAELVSQLDMGYSLDVTSAYPAYGSLIVKLFKELILSGEKDNQKNAIQALKLCGANLEKLCETGDWMEELMMQCGQVEKQPGVDQTIMSMLARLGQLRNINWGYVERAASSKYDQNAYSTQQQDYNQQAVMYGPDGKQISTEEMGFLLGVDSAGSGDCASSEGGGSTTGSGMDDEALEAYEQFLLESGQK